MRLADSVKEFPLKEGFNGEILPKSEWGWCVEAEANGYRICAPDNTRFEAVSAALDTVKWALTQPPYQSPSDSVEAAEEALEG